MTPAELRARVANLRNDLYREADHADREARRYVAAGDQPNAGEAYGRWRACESVKRRLNALLSEYDASARGDKPCG